MPVHLKKQNKDKNFTLKALYTSFTKDFINGKVSMNLQYQNEPKIEFLNVTPEMQKDIDDIDLYLN